AAGGGVAVGAIVVVNVVDIKTTAETLRSLTAGGSVTLAARTVTEGVAEAEASAEGTTTAGAGGSNSDEQAQGQVDKTPATQGKNIKLPDSSSKVGAGNDQAQSNGGKKSDGVGVGAAVSVNWMTVSTTAEIPTGLTIIAGGSVGVL